ncbi:MAG: YiiD C-terminal domain-containing protein [Bacteroidota bacterium]|nr:YiiD C-terminal domain-containing protein [Bacteroidota bacterium]
MDITEIPFHNFLGLQKSDNDQYILKLEERQEYLNHLGTVHASVLFALAESTSGEFLLKKFKDYELDVIPVVRKAEIKYSKPVNGQIFSKAEFVNTDVRRILEELKLNGRILIKIKVDVFNSEIERTMTGVFEWFLAMKKNK